MLGAMSDPVIVNEFQITVEQEEDFRFVVQFDKEQFAPLTLDEPAPLGHDTAPNAARILAAAVGNCLAASFLLCARKSRAKLGPVRADVKATLARNEQGRIRVSRLDVRLDPRLAPEDQEKAARCRQLFEDYCIVTQSVRQGIDVQVTVV